MLWTLGYPDQALKRVQAALALARCQSNLFSLAWVLDHGAAVYRLRGEQQTAQEMERELTVISREQGFRHWLAEELFRRGRDNLEQKPDVQVIVQMQQGLAALQTLGTRIGRPYALALLARAHGKVGQSEDGIAVLAEALAFVTKTGNRSHETELYRLMGELTLQWFGVETSLKSPASRSQHPAPERRQKLKRIFITPSTLPVLNKPNHGSCGQK